MKFPDLLKAGRSFNIVSGEVTVRVRVSSSGCSHINATARPSGVERTLAWVFRRGVSSVRGSITTKLGKL